MDTMKSDVLVKPEPEETVSDSDLNRLNEDSQIEYTMEEQYKCDLCEKAFNKRLSLVCHRTSHSEKYRCDLCTKTFRQKNSFVNHKKYLCGNVEEQYSCYICKKVFPRKETLVYHIKSQHESEKFGCDLCKKKFNREETLERHKEWHNIERTVEKYTPEFKVDAVKRVREIGVTEAAKQLFVDKTSLKRWTRYIFNPLFCSFCGKGFGEQNALKIHEEGHQNQLKHYQCDKCSKMFACSTDLQFACWLKLHMKACPGNLERKERKPTKKRKRKYEKNHQCDKCSKLFPRPSALNRHMKICSDLKSDSKTYQYQCDKCPKSFASPYTLKYHKQACSGTADYNQDPIIDKQFIQTVVQLANETSVSNSCQVYKLNYARVYGWVSQHNSPDKHKCEICHKIFAHKQTHGRHMETHKKDDQPLGEMEREEKEITSNYSQSFKKEAVKLAREASFEESCRINNISTNLLAEWINVIENLIICEVCSKSFKLRSNFEKHMQLHYTQENKTNLTERKPVPDLRELYLQKYPDVEESTNPNGERKYNETKGDDSIDDKYLIKTTINTDVAAILEDNGESCKQISETGSENTENSCNDRNTGNDTMEIYYNSATVAEEMYLDAQTIKEELALEDDEEMCTEAKTDEEELSQKVDRNEIMDVNLRSQCEKNTVNVLEPTVEVNEGPDQCDFVSERLEGLEQHKSEKPLDTKIKEESGNMLIKIETINDTKDGLSFEAQEKNDCKVKHFRSVHRTEKSFACDVCDKMFFKKRNRDRHENLKHLKEKSFACELCDMKFSRMETLTVHHRKHTGEKPYKCEKCDDSFVTQGNLQSHMDSHLESSKDFQCIDCGKLFGSDRRLKKHVKSVHLVFPCTTCTKTFSRKDSLERHMKSHLGIKDFQCIDCGKLFSAESSLRQHVDIHNNKVFPCNRCGKEFKYKPNLNTHIKTHLGIKRRKETKDFPCMVCGKQYARDKKLQEHISIVHHGERRFECGNIECGKKFTRLNALKQHNLLHTDENPYTCEFCSKGYKAKANLMKHIEMQHG